MYSSKTTVWLQLHYAFQWSVCNICVVFVFYEINLKNWKVWGWLFKRKMDRLTDGPHLDLCISNRCVCMLVRSWSTCWCWTSFFIYIYSFTYLFTALIPQCGTNMALKCKIKWLRSPVWHFYSGVSHSCYSTLHCKKWLLAVPTFYMQVFTSAAV